MRTHSRVTSYFAGRVHRERDLYVSECEGLPVASQGKSESEAIANLVEALQLFLDSTLAHNALGEVVRRYGWHPMTELPAKEAPDRFIIPVRVPRQVM